MPPSTADAVANADRHEDVALTLDGAQRLEHPVALADLAGG